MKILRSIRNLLCASWLVAGGGCATMDNGRAPDPAATPAATAAETPYPAWTRVTGWLLTPFTGASASVGF